MGKTKFLEHMIREDILAGHGVCLIDPHGDLFKNVVEWCAAAGIEKSRRIHIIDPSLQNWRTGFNPLARYADEKPLDRVDSMLEALAQVWGGVNAMETPSIRSVLRAVFTILIESGQTLADAFPLTRLNDDDALREYFAEHIDNPIVREMWDGYVYQAAKAPREFVVEFGGPRRRLFELLHDEHLREMFGQVEHAIDFRKVMDDSDIVLVNLSENALDEKRAQALGALLVRELFLVAKRRDPEKAKSNPFYLYIDECAQFLTNDISKLLAQTRKFGLHAILAHQWLEQLREASPAIFAAVMAIQNKVVFGGLADVDAEMIANELFRTEYDLEMPVELLIKPTVIGVVQTWLRQWSSTETDGETDGSASSSMAATYDGVSQVFDIDGFPIGGVSRNTGANSGTTTSASSANTHSSSRTEGESESYIPEFANLPSAVHSLEAIKHLAIVRLRSLPERNAVAKGPGSPSFDMTTFPTHPKTVHPDSRISFMDRLLKSSPYSLSATNAKETIRKRVDSLREDVRIWSKPPETPDEPDRWRG